MAKTLKEMQAELEALQAENAALKAAKAQGGAKITFKVGEKGTISVYGLGRFPVSLYPGQWQRFMPHIPELAKFIEANANHPAVVAANQAHAK